MAGVQNIVAPQGTAFTADHARIMKRYVDEVVLCFDSDTAGQNAAVRSLDHLLASGLAVRVATIPAPHDPDSFIKQSGGEAFKQLIERAEGFFDYYLHYLCAANPVTSDKGRLGILRSMAEAVHKTGNGVLIDKYAQKTALRLGVSPDSVRAEFKKIPRINIGADEDEVVEPVPEQAPPGAQESWLLKLLLVHEDLTEWAAAHLDAAWVQHPLVREIVALRLAAHANHTWSSLAAFLNECPHPEQRRLITEVTATERPLPNPAQQIADVALKLRNAYLEKQMSGLMVKLNQPETLDEQRLDLIRQREELRALKRRPLAAAGEA
jgi:DNA primase